MADCKLPVTSLKVVLRRDAAGISTQVHSASTVQTEIAEHRPQFIPLSMAGATKPSSLPVLFPGCARSLWLLRLFSSCCKWRLLPSCGVLASVAAKRELWGTPASEAVPHGLIAPWHVASSQTSDRVCVSRLGMQILYTPEPPGKPHVQTLYGTYIFIWGGC